MQSLIRTFEKSIITDNKKNALLLRDIFLKFDIKTKQHSQRVNRLIKAYLGNRHTSLKIVKDIQISALIHDIGKLAIPDIISKKLKLSDEEYLLVRLHVVFGYILGIQLNLKNAFLRAIFTHHIHPNRPVYISKQEILNNIKIIYTRMENHFNISEEEVDSAITNLFENWEIMNHSNMMSDIITLWDSFDAATGIDRDFQEDKTITDIVLEFKDLFGKQFNEKYKESFITFVKTKAFVEITRKEYSNTTCSIKDLSRECIRSILKY